mmetsp:Transcript_16629/g.47734  ORF Transcript_16629/g.47734 Transcript_16629/m.47734 type:complete len:301 (+) Transcript_16629:59-961(+)
MRTTSLPSALFGAPPCPAFLPTAPRVSSHLTLATRAMSSSKIQQVEVEIEEKFPLPADIVPVEATLRGLGFSPKGGGVVSFVDTYYDFPSPHWYLTPRDTWLRFRGVKQNDMDSRWEGKWQLKIRRKSSEGDNSAAVAYEEIQGGTALDRVSEILASANFGGDGIEEEYDAITDAPVAPNNLIPFAQFETTRSSWVIDDKKMPMSEYLGLSVDIDATDFGYGVGEVEAILNKGDDMADARKRIGQLVAEICAASSDQTESVTPSTATGELPTVGKLETYLMEKRPEHFNAIITAGIFKPI